MSKHVKIHGWSGKDLTTSGEVCGEQEIVGHAVGHFGQGVCSSRGYDESIGPKTETYVAVPSTILGVEKIDEDRVLGKSCERERSDELLGHRRHDDAHLGTTLNEFADERGRLVGSDSTRDTDENMFTPELHDIKIK